jgi:hypothetical protein
MPGPRLPPDLALLLTLGWTLAVWIAGGLLLGRWADNIWGWHPWGAFGGAAAGLAGAGYTVWRVVKGLDRSNRDQGPH